jgi:predicted regulator of Ras-like GTPase activity (Roadblock/LC7/MglB family)
MSIDSQTAKTWLDSITQKREFLVTLLEQPNLGTIRIDVNQALEEMDDLIDEFKRTFPE